MKEEHLQLYETIEQYLTGDLVGERLKAFEERIESDPELQREVALHRRLNQVMEDQPKMELRSKLQQLRKKHQVPDQTDLEKKTKIIPLYRRKKWLAVAAALALLIASIVVLRNSFSDPAYQPYAQLEAQLGDTDENDGMNFIIDPFSTENSYFPEQDGWTTWQIKGQLKTVELSDQDRFTVQIYNNQNELIATSDTPSNLPIAFEGPLEDPATLAFGQDLTYPFLVQQKMFLTKGLYYYVVTLEGEAESLYVGKFRVEE